MGILVTQLRAVIAAAGLLGTIGFLYTFGAPWIVWIVDQWGAISEFLLGWLPFDFTEFQSALFASFTIFGLAAFIGLRSDARLSTRLWMLILIVFALVAFYLGGRFNLFTPSFLDGKHIAAPVPFMTYILIIYSIMVFILSSLTARSYTISVTFWIGVAFLFDRLYRVMGTPNLTPPTP